MSAAVPVHTLLMAVSSVALNMFGPHQRVPQQSEDPQIALNSFDRVATGPAAETEIEFQSVVPALDVISAPEDRHELVCLYLNDPEPLRQVYRRSQWKRSAIGSIEGAACRASHLRLVRIDGKDMVPLPTGNT